LNFDLLKENVINEVTESREEPQEISVQTHTRSNEMSKQKHCKRLKKPNNAKWSLTNALWIPTPFYHIDDIDMQNVTHLLDL